jgi:hypothetical protein
MSWKIAQTIALMLMAVIFGLALLWIFGRALMPHQSANTSGIGAVAGGFGIGPLKVAMFVAVLVAAAELLLRRKRR